MNQIESINEEKELRLLKEGCARLCDDAARCGDDECSSIAARFVRLLHSPHRSIAANTARFINREISVSESFGNRLVESGAVHALVALVSDLDNFCEESLSLLQTLFELCSLSWRIVAPALVPLVAALRKYGLSPAEFGHVTTFLDTCEALVDVCKHASIPAV